ncbi:hypothetical protein HYV86_06175 [Candidatus Woesearchaeota archaeon]|nr:hypothetical protein [Candidatus Woesearchaeota archaeon]
MVSYQELRARIHESYSFNRQEVVGLIAAVGFTAFIFSFRDWGTDSFNAAVGIGNFLLVAIIAAFSFWFRFTCQKIFGLSQGYLVVFRLWWTGIFIALALAFITSGRLPLILIGGIVPSFMVRQRLGEFRYGFGYKENAVISMWSIWSHLILAIIFSMGLYLFPSAYFFEKGLLINLIAAALCILPLPQLDGLSIFFGSRSYFMLCIVAIIAGSILLLTNTLFGIIISAIIGLLAGGFFILIGSEK